MFDIFVVVCKDDFPQLKILGRSIDKFCQSFPINRIVVVGNDRDTNLCDSINNQRRYFGKFSDSLSIYNYDEIYDSPWHHGYDVQQVLKLYSYKVCSSDYIAILDAKNFFTNTVELGKVLNQEKLRAVYDTVPQFWLENKIYTHKLFDLPPETRQMMIRTPFFITRKILIECVSYLKEKLNLSLYDIIGHKGSSKTNEFMLLQSFIIKKYGNLENYFFFTNDNPQQGNYNSGIWPIDIERWSEFHWDLIDNIQVPRNLERVLTLEYANGDGIFCSGVHRQAIKLMNEDFIEQLKSFWIKLELCDYNEATDVIEGVKKRV